MENTLLSENVKKIRIKKGLSQNKLATIAGLSLRTIQRIENGQANPTGETLDRIARILEIPIKVLIEKIDSNISPEKTFKAKYEYLHIFKDKLVITKTSKIENLVEDYNTSIKNIFKSLMVFFVCIPLFSVLSIFFYSIDVIQPAIYSGFFALVFLYIAFYSMLFTSGTSLIKTKQIEKISLKRLVVGTFISIRFKEQGRIKKRGIHFNKENVSKLLAVLQAEKLIYRKNIDLKVNYFQFFIPFTLITLTNFYFFIYKKNRSSEELFAYFGTYILIIIIIFISFKIMKYLRKKKIFIFKTTKNSIINEK